MDIFACTDNQTHNRTVKKTRFSWQIYDARYLKYKKKWEYVIVLEWEYWRSSVSKMESDTMKLGIRRGVRLVTDQRTSSMSTDLWKPSTLLELTHLVSSRLRHRPESTTPISYLQRYLLRLCTEFTCRIFPHVYCFTEPALYKLSRT